ncbi:MAG: hypothetical protein CSA53_01400 [Gammaproteobacteria bacterium]|nr:MAG: hypothetical protein CSA53_01400 [Gammaproteobacteria bacterium]
MTETTPFFSVVVPTRNRVDWLRRCLQGIAEQTYDNYEVVIIDDGSDADVAEAYTAMTAELGKRFRLIFANSDSRHRMGPSAVRNWGIEQARGEYIAFCDDDDYWIANDLLATAATALKSNGADLFFSDQKAVSEDRTIYESSFRRVRATLQESQRLSELDVYAIDATQMLSFPDYAHLNITIARKTLLDKTGRFWLETRYAEDVDLFVRLCDQAEGILFRPTVCSVHNAPMNHSRESASKAVGDVNRRLLEGSVYWHLLAVCKTDPALSYASAALNANSKVLTEELEQAQSPRAAAAVARMAWGAQPTFKWGLYALLRSVQAWLKR